MTRYRIVEVDYRSTNFFNIEKRGWLFWSPLRDYEEEIITFYNLEFAEAHLERLLVASKRTVVKEVDTERLI